MRLLKNTPIFFTMLVFILASSMSYSQPANNNQAAATNISALINNCSANGAYTTVGATADQAKGSCWTNGPNYNVWFSFVATTTYMKVQVKTGGAEGTLQYPFVALWDAGLVQLACQNQNGSSTDIEMDYLGLTVGNTYYISVDNYNGGGYRGTFKLCLSDVVDYNFKEGAVDVTGILNNCSADAAYTTVDASADNAKGSCWTNGPNYNRWFKFTASTAYINVQVKTGGAEGTLQYPFVAIWDASLTQLSCQNQNGASTDIETNYYGLTPGNTYYISVDNYVGAGYRGTFKLCLSDVVDYDYKEGAVDVTGILNNCSADAAYSTLYASADQAKGSCWTNGPNYNRWFKFTASTTYIKVQVKTGGSEGTLQYPFVALWDASLTQLACQNQNGASTDIETNYYGLTPGNTYYISVDNYVGANYRGTFKLCLSDVVDYDYKEGALDVGGIINTCSADAAYSTLYASADQAKGSCWTNGPNYNRWFKFTASTTYIKVQVKTGGSEGTLQYPFVAIWDASLTQLACQNQNGSSTDIETNYYGLTLGNTYYISVDNYVGAGYRGTFKLCLSDVVDYDYKEGALDVGGIINTCSADAAYSTLYASADQAKGSCWTNGPNYNRWFKFTASTTYIKVQVNTGGSEGTLQYPFVALWDASLTQVTCQNQNGASTDIELNYLGLTIGNTYYISVDNYTGANYRGTFKLCLSDVVDYDYKEGAKVLTDLDNWCSANAFYTTAGASADQAKGSCWTNGPNYNRWFKFQAIFDTVRIQVKVGGAEGTMQYPFVALWNSTLTQIGCTNQSGASTDITLQYNNLTVGNWYYISVDNYVGAGYRGTFTLCVNNVSANKYYAIADGDWSTNNTWSRIEGGPAATSCPSASNVVYIKGYDVTVSGNNSCAALYMTVLTDNTTLTVTGATLNVGGKLTLTNSGTNKDGVISLATGMLNVGNDATFTRSGGNQLFQLLLNNSTMTVGQDMSWISTAGTSQSNEMALNIASSVVISRDLILNYSGGQDIIHTVNNSSILTVGRDITFTSTAAGYEEVQLNNTSTLNIARNFVRGGTPYGILTCNGSSTVVFNGTSNTQTIPASAGACGDGFTFNNITINNTCVASPSITMGGIATVNGTLTLTSGTIQTTNSSVLTISNTGSISGSASCFIDGPLKKIGNTAFTFPIGDGNVYAPISISAPANVTAEFTAEYDDGGYTNTSSLESGVTRVSIVEYWNLDRNVGTSPGDDVFVTLHWQNGDTRSGINNLDSLIIVHWDGAVWDNKGNGGTTGNTAAGTITSTAKVGSFSPFTFGTIAFLDETNPLPISLLYFDATAKNNMVDIKWGTASESNNDYFTIERTKDGLTFDIVKVVNGAVNSNELITYNVIDENPYEGVSYYRLKQTDFDGKYTYSKLVPVEFTKLNDNITFKIYPNPANVGESVYAEFTGIGAGKLIDIVVKDITGKEVISKALVTSNDGISIQAIDPFNKLSSGIYSIIGGTANKLYCEKLVVK